MPLFPVYMTVVTAWDSSTDLCQEKLAEGWRPAWAEFERGKRLTKPEGVLSCSEEKRSASCLMCHPLMAGVLPTHPLPLCPWDRGRRGGHRACPGRDLRGPCAHCQSCRQRGLDRR